jgi:arylsulfatase A-like enzyme
MCAHEDFIPTFAAAAGDPNIVDELLKGYALNGKTFKVHLDGNNLMPFFKGEVDQSPREEFLYWSDDADLMALRVRNWKIAFMEQHTEINPETPLGVWQGQFTKLRAPNLYNLRADPFERGTTSIYYATGRRAGRSRSCPRRLSSRSISRASRSSRRVQRRRASPQRRDGQDPGGKSRRELTATRAKLLRLCLQRECLLLALNGH